MANDREEYWQRVRERAAELGSDGCSGVPDFYLDCCLEHDIHYRTGYRLDGTRLTREDADTQLRQCIQARSTFGRLSPMAWWRWAGVRLFGQRAWPNWTAPTTPNPPQREAP